MKRRYFSILLILICLCFSCENPNIIFYPGFDFVYDKSTDEVTIVGYNEWTESIESLEFPESLYGKPVTAIGYECEADKYGDPIGNYSIDGYKAKSIDDYIKELVLPQTVKQINNFAFAKCVDSVIDKNNITNISGSGIGFYDRIEVYLEKIILLSKNPPKLYEYSLDDCKAIFYVPVESLNLYKTAQGWKDYADRIFAIEK